MKPWEDQGSNLSEQGHNLSCYLYIIHPMLGYKYLELITGLYFIDTQNVSVIPREPALTSLFIAAYFPHFNYSPTRYYVSIHIVYGAVLRCRPPYLSQYHSFSRRGSLPSELRLHNLSWTSLLIGTLTPTNHVSFTRGWGLSGISHSVLSHAYFSFICS